MIRSKFAIGFLALAAPAVMAACGAPLDGGNPGDTAETGNTTEDQQALSCSIGGCIAGWRTNGSCKYHQVHVNTHCVANTNCHQVVVDSVEFRGGTASGCCDATNDGLWWTQGGITLVDSTSGALLWASGVLLQQTNCSTADGYHKYNVGKTIFHSATMKFFWTHEFRSGEDNEVDTWPITVLGS